MGINSMKVSVYVISKIVCLVWGRLSVLCVPTRPQQLLSLLLVATLLMSHTLYVRLITVLTA